MLATDWLTDSNFGHLLAHRFKSWPLIGSQIQTLATDWLTDLMKKYFFG